MIENLANIEYHMEFMDQNPNQLAVTLGEGKYLFTTSVYVFYN